MKTYILILVLFCLFIGCSKTDIAPDYTGTYSGGLTGACISITGSTPLSANEDIIIIKSGSEFILRNWENFDLKIVFNTTGGNTFKVESYKTSTSKASLTGIFDSNSITISGSSESLTSSTFCTYTYKATKK